MYDAALVDAIIPLMPGLPERLDPGDGPDVLDVGTGQGHAVNLPARAFPAGRFTGMDMSESGIAAARLSLRNAHFGLADAAAVTGPYDLVTAFGVIHDLVRPAQTLAAVAGALRDDGVFLMGDIAASSKLEENLDLPLGPALPTFSVFSCMTVSLGEGGVPGRGRGRARGPYGAGRPRCAC
ncbi:class I SAM-dependent methyltransferase [Streptomyces parvus]|uniref:class I SAM-dependent methyltransferase n=1 Tax=Streptomyces parvus TaxID=66428 RepID=UPI003630F7E5